MTKTYNIVVRGEAEAILQSLETVMAAATLVTFNETSKSAVNRNGHELRQQQTDAVAVIPVQPLDAGVGKHGDRAGGDRIHAVEQDG